MNSDDYATKHHHMHTFEEIDFYLLVEKIKKIIANYDSVSKNPN